MTKLPLLLFAAATVAATLPSPAEEIRREPLVLREGGTPGEPAVFDGKGLVVDLGIDVSDHPWRKQGGVWISDGALLDRRPPKDTQRAGLFIDQVPLRIVHDAAPDTIEPGRMGFARDGSLFFRGPEGKTPGESRIILPPDGLKSAVVIACSHIVVRNITARYAANDGFNLHGKWKGIRLENVKAFSNGDEGISAHGEIEMEVEGAEVAWNGSSAGGVADVSDSVTSYRNCHVHHNLGAGFYFDGKSHRVSDTLISYQDRDIVVPDPGKTTVESERVEWRK